MILIENKQTNVPYVDVYTYNMIQRFTFTRCTVKEDFDSGVYVVTTYDDGFFVAAFPIKETAYMQKTPENGNNIVVV